jgi:predicted nuclease of predicted toxin-antitoxin system
MSLSVLIDMNLSPAWVDIFTAEGWAAVHWSTIGHPAATDDLIMQWAIDHGHVVFTHDLDFGTMLALTHARGPSVIQLRTEDILPNQHGHLVVGAMHQHTIDLLDGALIVIDLHRSRIRILPI